MNSKFTYILEIIWLVVAILSSVLGIYRIIKLGLDQSYMLFIIAAVSLAMYALRRGMRKANQNKGN